ncbi:RNA polymerase sigma-70 factor [bacterium]|nr:RNA polymerase sigma-70 factor [bacterium]
MSIPETDDRILSIRIRESDQSAFKELYLRYYEAISRYVWYRLRSREQVEDLVQEVFTRLWSHRSRLRPDKSVKAYLYRTASNLIVDRYRKRGSETAFLSEVKSPVTDDSEETDIRLSMEAAIACLPPKEKTVVMLSRYEGLKYQEIADICHISVKTVESRMTKAFRRLREELDDQ